MRTFLLMLAVMVFTGYTPPNKPGWYFPFQYRLSYDVQINATEGFHAKEIRNLDKIIKASIKYFPEMAKVYGHEICRPDIIPEPIYMFGFEPEPGWLPFYSRGKKAAFGYTENIEWDLPRLLGEMMSAQCGLDETKAKFVAMELQCRVVKALDSWPN